MKSLNLEITTTHKIVGNLLTTEKKTVVAIHAWSTAFTTRTQNGVRWVMDVTEMEEMTSHTLRASVGDVVEFEGEGGKVTIICTDEGAQVTNLNSKLKATVRKNDQKEFKYIAPITTPKFQYPRWW